MIEDCSRPRLHLRWLAAAAALSLALHLRAEYWGPRWQVYLFKPLTTSLILLVAALAVSAATARYRRAVVAGLALSLVGDVLLMLPGDHFVGGLVAFLLAHLAYLVAFTDRVGVRLLGVATPVYLLAGAAVVGPLWPRLGALRLPVLAYMAVIMAMAAQAAGRSHALRTRAARAAAAGAALFVVSDATLALDRFGGGIPMASAAIMVTYIAAQLLIAASVAADVSPRASGARGS